MNYYKHKDQSTRISKFKIDQLINIKPITANRDLNDNCLSKTFNKIIAYRYNLKDNSEQFTKLNKHITDINETITEQISSSHTDSINETLYKIESNKKLKVELSSELTFDKLMSNLIRYEYAEKEFNIPEEQFGLGYSNLMTIIGQLIEYIDKYQDEDYQGKINLICIEEPEAFMHPQMQELFIKHIDDAVSYLLKNTQKKINSQIIITTHSSHILNSKIHSGNSFDNIIYIFDTDNYSKVVNLDDKKVRNDEIEEKNENETAEEYKSRKTNELKFLKKHIKYKVSELFFCDAAIFVEGITEETILSYFIDSDKELNKYYISIFNIDGAHGHIYHPLIKLLKVPTLIITDLDIKRTDQEKEEYTQIKTLDNRSTTNRTIIKFNNGDDISKINKCFKDENINLTFQNKINGYYATSFEESLILTNYKSDIINNVLKRIKKQIYANIVGREEDRQNLKENSYKLQKKLSNSKSNFANELLYEIIINDDIENKLKLPSYIIDGLEWLKSELKGGN